MNLTKISFAKEQEIEWITPLCIPWKQGAIVALQIETRASYKFVRYDPKGRIKYTFFSRKYQQLYCGNFPSGSRWLRCVGNKRGITSYSDTEIKECQKEDLHIGWKGGWDWVHFIYVNVSVIKRSWKITLTSLYVATCESLMKLLALKFYFPLASLTRCSWAEDVG